MDKKRLFSELDSELKKVGFERKAAAWYQRDTEIIKVIHLQKSNYSNLFYVNLCFYFKGIDDSESYPKEQQCHIRTRLSSSILDAPKDFNYLFDLENFNSGEIDMTTDIKKCVSEGIIPQLDSIKSKEGILKIAEKIPAILNMLPLNVKAFLQFES